MAKWRSVGDSVHTASTNRILSASRYHIGEGHARCIGSVSADCEEKRSNRRCTRAGLAGVLDVGMNSQRLASRQVCFPF